MKNNPETIKRRLLTDRRGFILLVTMVVLVVLASLTTGLSVSLSMAKRRQQYMIEYQRARYGLDSGIKYILKEFPIIRFGYEDRTGKPDFSDVFLMSQTELGQYITAWAETATDEELEASLKEGASLTPVSEGQSGDDLLAGLMALLTGGDDAEPNSVPMDVFDPGQDYEVVELDPNDVFIPGPYGPAWPMVVKPMEMDVGPCGVTITIEDENAKMPLSWLVTRSQTANKKALNSLKTFCEWMAWDAQQYQALENMIQDSMEEIAAEKKFALNAGPIIVKQTKKQPARTTSAARRTTTRRRTTAQTRTTQTTTTTQKRPAIAHRTDFAKLFHSPLLDREFLARPLPDTGERIESPLKYLSLWGAQRVNINTAPRHVLLAALEIAADSFEFPELAQAIIERRREKPFTKLDELKELGDLDSDTMRQLGNYLTTTSTFFKIRIDSESGSARSSAVATVVREGKNTQVLAILYEP